MGLKSVLVYGSTERHPTPSVAYLYDFEHFSCAFGSVVVYVLEFWHGKRMLLVLALCKLKPQCQLPPSLAAGLFQSLKDFFLNLPTQKSGCSH